MHIAAIGAGITGYGVACTTAASKETGSKVAAGTFAKGPGEANTEGAVAGKQGAGKAGTAAVTTGEKASRREVGTLYRSSGAAEATAVLPGAGVVSSASIGVPP